MTTPENPLIDAARGRDPQPPAETQAEMLRRLAAAADKHGQHIYTHWRDSNAAKANEEWHNAASPELVISLLDRIAQLEAQRAAEQERKPVLDFSGVADFVADNWPMGRRYTVAEIEAKLRVHGIGVTNGN